MIRKRAVTVVLAFCLGVASAYSQHVGLEFYDNLADLPYIYSNVEACYLSSYDRSGGNDDGFRGTYSALYVDDKGEQVIFDEDGPGCVYNLWFTDIGGPTSPRKVHNSGTCVANRRLPVCAISSGRSMDRPLCIASGRAAFRSRNPWFFAMSTATRMTRRRITRRWCSITLCHRR